MSETKVTVNESISTAIVSKLDTVSSSDVSESTSIRYGEKSTSRALSSSNSSVSGKVITGASFTGNTVNRNPVASVNSPSVTTTMIVA